MESEAASREEELDDIKFFCGDQWPLNVKSDRLRDKRPCLTVNQIPQFVRQVTNDERQNRPSVKVNPVDDKATIETAEILEGMTRHIEYASCGDIAIDTAAEWAAKSGIGYYALQTDYVHSMSFQQEIQFRTILDRFCVYTDPYWSMPDGSDMQWGFIVSDPSRDEFKAEYPNAKLNEVSSWEGLNSHTPNWFTKNTCKVAEYYYKTYEEVEIHLLSDGTEVEAEDLDELPDTKKDKDGYYNLKDGRRSTSKRTTQKIIVHWAKINGIEILDETEILGEYIPIIPVIGEVQIVEGKKVYAGITRQLKDPQRMYNYFASAETEAIALAPRAPFVAAAGQIEGFEEQWQMANVKNIPVLQYKPKAIDGTPCPPPQRQVAEPAVQAITQAMQMRANEMKATTGIYDPTLGKQTNEMSGVAIQRRINQSGTATFHYSDNLSRSQRHGGRIMLCWIPKVYNKAQAVRIIGDDGSVDFAKVNQIFDEGGESKSHFLDHGQYDCTISTGPSYQTKRQEAVASMLDLARAMPQSMQFGLDLLVRNMDWPGSQEIADRIKKMLPPQLVNDNDPVPPAAQAQMKQMNQMVQVLSKQNQEYMDLIKNKSLELASKEKIAAMEQKTQLAIELMKHDQKDAALIFQAEQDHIDRQLAMDQQQMENQINQTQLNNGAGPQGTGAPQNMPTGAASPGQSMGAQQP